MDGFVAGLQTSMNALQNSGGYHHMLSTSSLSLPPEIDISNSFTSPIFQLSQLNASINDVVLLGEFSEIEGPVPLVTIPESTELTIDINDFIVKLMSVDYQNISIGEFQICEDTQLLQFDIEKGFHVYVHYFTLYDERARGFVRPMCLAYISRDARKLQKYFLQIKIEFRLASNYLKSCNLQIFRDEMNARISDLHYTKHRYIIANRDLQNDPPEDAFSKKWPKRKEHSKSMDNLEQSSSYQDLVTNRKKRDFLKLSPITDNITEKNYLSSYHITEDTASSAVKTSSEQLLKQSLVISEIKNKSVKVSVRVTTGTVSQLSLEEEAALLQHTSLEAIAYQLLDCQHILSVIREQIEEDVVQEHIQKLNETILSDPSSYLATSMKLLKVEHFHVDHVKGHTPSVFVMSAMRRTFQDMRAIREISDLGYIACLLKLLDIHSKYSRPLVTQLFDNLDKSLSDNLLQSLYIGNIPIIGLNSKYNNSKEEPSNALLKCALDYNDRLVNLFFSSGKKPNGNRDDISSVNCENNDSVANIPSGSDSDADSLFLKAGHREYNALKTMIATKETSAEEALDFGSEFCHLDIDDRIFTSKACHLSGLIQQFRGVSHCLIHSLLSGRPVILAAPHHLKSLVVMYTEALTKILPYHKDRLFPVLRWHTGTITEHHLIMYKVMGVCIPERLHIQDLMSNSTLNQVTVLNIETGHISGIAYSGSLLNGLEQFSRRQFHTDPPLQVALQAILVVLGLKVYLLYYLKQTTNKTTNQILKGLGIAKGDWSIITYLVSIIKQQTFTNILT